MFNLENLVRKNILELKPYSSARDEYKGEEGIFLDANENPYGVLNRYPDPYQKKLKAKISGLKNVKEENIFIGNGSDEVIDLAFRIFCKPGTDKALVFTPTYGMYEVAAGINDTQLVTVPLNENFQVDFNHFEKYCSDESIKILFLCSPNNPTGNSINNIRRIIEKSKGIVIVDEAYIDFSEQTSCIDLIGQYPNLIVMQTFSKAWGLAAARIGTAYSNTAIIAFLNSVKPPYNISGLNQGAALSALEQEENYKTQVALILEQKKWLEKQLAQQSLVKKVYPSDANFLLVEVEDADQLYEQLITKKLITRNRNKLIKNCLRITVGSPEENILLIKAFENLAK